MVNKDLLHLLAGFPFTRMERLIISLLVDYPTGLNLQEIQKEISNLLTTNESKLTEQINDLIIKKMVIKLPVSPEKFLLNTKKPIQERLDSIIHDSQQQLDLQKTNYYPILTTIQEIQELGKQKTNLRSQKSAKLSSEISVEFIREWITELSEKHPIDIINIEKNIISILRDEYLNFRLTTVEFQYTPKNISYYGMIIFCEFENLADHKDYFKKIHLYHVDGIKFRYKLEQGQYFKEKQRSLQSFRVVGPNLELSTESNEFLTKFEVVFPQTEVLGTLISKNTPLKKNYVCSIFSENEQLLTWFDIGKI
jgi:hypothetical protein